MANNETNDLRSETMRANIRRGERTRVVIVGCGLGGLKLAVSLRHRWLQLVWSPATSRFLSDDCSKAIPTTISAWLR